VITPQQLKAVFPACKNCGPWVRIFGQMVDEFDLRPANRLVMFLAQCGYESESFMRLREDMSYSAAELVATWPHVFTDTKSEVTQKYQRNPAGLANFIYAGKDGNGHEGTGDGLKFRGGGLIQLTGRANYTQVGNALGVRLDIAPQMIEQPILAARTAGYFWKIHDLNAAADAGDFDYTTRKINDAAMLGAAERRQLWANLIAQNVDSAVIVPRADIPAPPTTRGQAPGPVAPGTVDGIMDPDYRKFSDANPFSDGEFGTLTGANK
jgi:putative chitinase